MKRILYIAAAAFIFGLLSAYISIQIFNQIDVNSERPNNQWYDVFMVTLAPAGFIHGEIFGPNDLLTGPTGDKFDNENIIPTMLLNGAGWMVIVLFFTFPILCLRACWRKS